MKRASKMSVHEMMENHLKKGDIAEVNNGKVDRIIPGFLVRKGEQRNEHSR